MTIVKRIAFIAVALIVYLVIFDVIGVLFSLLLQIFFDRNMSLLAIHAAWFVMGVFMGLLHFQLVFEWKKPKNAPLSWKPENARALGIWIITVSTAILAALAYAFYCIWWRRDVQFDGFVPDNRGPTLTFFGSIIAAMFVAQRTYSDPPKADLLKAPKP